LCGFQQQEVQRLCCTPAFAKGEVEPIGDALQSLRNVNAVACEWRGAVDEKCLRALLCVSGTQPGQRPNFSSKRKGVNALAKVDVQYRKRGLDF